MTFIGWAADGFPICARYGCCSATDATTLYAMGTFVQDYEYEAGPGDLDECIGRTGVTPAFPAGNYHYFTTDTYPYLQRCVKGTPAR